MLRSSYFNLLLVCVPLSWAASSLRWGAVPVFALNFTSLIPLALVLGQITEDLALRYGEEGERAGWGGGRGFAASFALGCVIVGEEAGGIFDARSLSFPPLDFSSLRPLLSSKKKRIRHPHQKATPSAASSTPPSATSSR